MGLRTRDSDVFHLVPRLYEAWERDPAVGQLLAGRKYIYSQTIQSKTEHTKESINGGQHTAKARTHYMYTNYMKNKRKNSAMKLTS